MQLRGRERVDATGAIPRTGFTLLELLVTLALLIGLGALVAAGTMWRSASDAQAAEAEVVSALREARFRSAAGGRAMIVECEQDGALYVRELPPTLSKGGDEAPLNDSTPPPPRRWFTATLPTGWSAVSITSDDPPTELGGPSAKAGSAGPVVLVGVTPDGCVTLVAAALRDQHGDFFALRRADRVGVALQVAADPHQADSRPSPALSGPR